MLTVADDVIGQDLGFLCMQVSIPSLDVDYHLRPYSFEELPRWLMASDQHLIRWAIDRCIQILKKLREENGLCLGHTHPVHFARAKVNCECKQSLYRPE